MTYEVLKNEFIKLKKEELTYFNDVAQISSNKILSEHEKLEIYRKLKFYESKVSGLLESLRNEIIKNNQFTRENLKDVLIEFDLGKKYFSKVNFHNEYYKHETFNDLKIDPITCKFKLTLSDIIRCREYEIIEQEIIQNNQKLIETPIYIFNEYYDANEDCLGPRLGDYEDYIYGIYYIIGSKNKDDIEISIKDMKEFEKGKIIISTTKYTYLADIKKIFKEELLNVKNKTLNDCVSQTKQRIKKLSYTRSPEYKEKVLLDKINELYKKTKGKFIEEEILYGGNFIDVLKGTYRLPAETTKKNESRKDSVVVVAITQDEKYIITLKNKINDKINIEFPSGLLKNNEDPITTAAKELKEQTGYITDDLFIVDKAYSSLESDNSITYIVIANNCIKTNEKENKDNQIISYEIFSKKELDYLINENIINSTIDKLAYYNLVNNVDECNSIYTQGKKYTKKKKANPFSVNLSIKSRHKKF